MLDRRGFLTTAAAAGAGAALLRPSSALAISGVRTFALFRGDEEIGTHTISANETAEGLAVDIGINIEVRRLGIRFYVYEHTNKELWRDGKLMRLTSTTNNDGKDRFARVERQGDTLKIEGTLYTGDAPGDAAPTSYWNYNNLSTRPWFSSEAGNILDLSLTKSQAGAFERWTVAGEVNLTLDYDAQREWRSCSFDGNGVPIVYRETSPGPALLPLV